MVDGFARVSPLHLNDKIVVDNIFLNVSDIFLESQILFDLWKYQNFSYYWFSMPKNIFQEIHSKHTILL